MEYGGDGEREKEECYAGSSDEATSELLDVW